MNMKAYPIPPELLQRIVNYLQQRPWAEVNGMLQQIMGIAQAVDAMSQAQNGKDEDQPAVQ